ncbi:hypothetical protein BGX21_008649, partial [Mortierella sp. AD011]
EIYEGGALATDEARARAEVRLQELLEVAHKQLAVLKAVDFEELRSLEDQQTEIPDNEALAEETINFSSVPGLDEDFIDEEGDKRLHWEEPLYNVLFDIPEVKLTAEQQTQVFIDEVAENVAIGNKKVIFDSLLSNFAIHDAGDAVGRAMNDRLQERTPGVLSFWVQDDMFELWLEEHSTFIGTKLLPDAAKPRLYGNKPKHGAIASWSFRCSCKGSPEIIPPEFKGGKSGKKRNRQPSKKQGCKASLTAYIKAIIPGEDTPRKRQTLVQYTYAHNHDLGAEDYLRQQRVSKQMKRRIGIMLLRGMSIQMVLQRLGMDARRCRRYALIVKGERPIRDDFITYVDIGDILRTMMNKEDRRDTWDNLSAFKWMQELESEEYFTFYDTCDMPNVEENEIVDKHGEYHGFASKWQMCQLLEYGETLFIDCTHKIYGLKTQAGVPVAFLMMRKLKASTIIDWLESLKEHIRNKFQKDYSPSVVVMDMGGTECSAVKIVFPEARIFYCAFHVLQAWQRKLKKDENLGLAGTDPETKQATKQKVQKELRAIVYEKDIAEALRKVDAFKRDWEGKPLLKYLENYYFKAKARIGDDRDNNAAEDAVNDEVSDEVNDEDGHGDGNEDSERGDETDGDDNSDSINDNGQYSKKNVDARYKRDRWMICYRQGTEYEHINIDDLIGEWHRTLRMHFFRDKLQRRADEVIYILTNDVVTFFEQKDVNAANNVGTSSPAQKQVETALKKAMECAKLKRRTFVSFLHAQSRTVVLVESFERPDIRYEVHLDFSRNSAGEISNCSCPVFSNEGECCEHIAMVMLANDRYPVFKRRSDWEPSLCEPQRDELTNDIDAPVVEGSATPKMDHLISQVEDIIQYFTTRDPNTPFSGLMEKGIQDFHLLIRKHDHPRGIRERQQNYKKIKLTK